MLELHGMMFESLKNVYCLNHAAEVAFFLTLFKQLMIMCMTRLMQTLLGVTKLRLSSSHKL